jgi:hypothetical protein
MWLARAVTGNRTGSPEPKMTKQELGEAIASKQD